MITSTHLFFDVGGVLGTPGWNLSQRKLAAERFGLNQAVFEERHQRVVPRFERGLMTLREYIDEVVFHVPQHFTRQEFKAFMFEQSAPFPESIAVARALSARGSYRLMTINNESGELNTYRLKHFGLTTIFSAFFSSCWLGVAKPSPRIYELALSLSQAQPERAIVIDDRADNLESARSLGMRTILFTNIAQLLTSLEEFGVKVSEGVIGRASVTSQHHADS